MHRIRTSLRRHKLLIIGCCCCHGLNGTYSLCRRVFATFSICSIFEYFIFIAFVTTYLFYIYFILYLFYLDTLQPVFLLIIIVARTRVQWKSLDSSVEGKLLLTMQICTIKETLIGTPKPRATGSHLGCLVLNPAGSLSILPLFGVVPR